MKISDSIGIGLCGAGLFCLITLIVMVIIVPRFGECYIDEQNYKHCTLIGFGVVSKEPVQ